MQRLSFRKRSIYVWASSPPSVSLFPSVFSPRFLSTPLEVLEDQTMM